ncbi:fibronectin type III domain-containing protein, partial [Bacteroides thetaiotaomicron]
MKKNYIYTVLFSLVLSAFTVSCSEPDDEVTTGIFDRLFSPTNVEAVIQKKTNVKFKWTAVTNATSYTIELYENQDMTFEGTPKTYEGITDNTYTVEGLLGETQYTAR